MAQLDASLILAGRPLDVVGAMRQGNAAAMETNALRQNNQLTELYQQQGPAIMRGDQNALAGVAALDPGLAQGFEMNNQSMRINEENLKVSYENAKLRGLEYAATIDAQTRAAEVEKMEKGLAGAAFFYQQGNKQGYVDFLTQNGLDPALFPFEAFPAHAAGIKGVMDAYKEFGADARPLPLTDQGKAAFDAQNGYITPEQANAPAPVDPQAATDIRKEFAGLQPIKNFAVQSDAYAKVVSAAKDPSAAGDLALIFSFMKMLDPTSVVREQEFANAQNAAGVPERLRAAYNNVLTGERLTPSTRADFLSQTQAIYAGAEQEYGNIEKQYRGLAERQGIPLEDALIDFRYSGPRYTPPVAMRDLARAGITGQGAPAQNQPAQGGPVVIDGYTVEAIE